MSHLLQKIQNLEMRLEILTRKVICTEEGAAESREDVDCWTFDTGRAYM